MGLRPHTGAPTVRVLTTRLFTAPAGGGERCTARLLAALVGQGCRVDVIGRGEGAPLLSRDGWGGAVADVADGPEPRSHSLGPLTEADRPFAEWPRWRRAAHVAAALCRGRSSTMLRLQGPGHAARSGTADRLRPADVVVVDHLQAWAWAPSHARGVAPVLVMHNLESDGYAEQAAVDPHPLRRAFLAREARLLSGIEQAAFARAAAIACLSEGDAEVLRARAAAHGTPVEVLPGYPQDVAWVGGPRGCEVPGRRIGLVGTWSWGPNRRALDWLLDEVVPRLPRACRVQVAGGGIAPGTPGHATAPVEVLGRIGDIAAFYAGLDVIAVPAVGGSGVQEKAIEAIATGLPVVATGHALRGLGPDLPGHVHRADSGADFARLCATVPAPEPIQAAAQIAAWRMRREGAYRAALARCIDAARGGAPRGTAAA
jgi:glycosyltransferase involved in cell wall biosynthesis